MRYFGSDESEQVIVNVKAAAINPVDYKIPFKMFGPVYGLDFSGTIESVGSSASSKFQIGDEVFGECKGSLAEKSICNIKKIGHRPDFLSFEEAAALPVAWPMLEIGSTKHMLLGVLVLGVVVVGVNQIVS